MDYDEHSEPTDPEDFQQSRPRLVTIALALAAAAGTGVAVAHVIWVHIWG